MRRVVNTAKAITNQGSTGNPAVPSLGGDRVKVQFRSVPPLTNFLKSHSVSELENRKIGIYKLKKKTSKAKNGTYIQFILTYKLKSTKYTVYSCTKHLPKSGTATHLEGRVSISKGLFQSKEFKLSELPKNIVDSIGQNIITFNELHGNYLAEENAKKLSKEQKKKQGFFQGLDT